MYYFHSNYYEKKVDIISKNISTIIVTIIVLKCILWELVIKTFHLLIYFGKALHLRVKMQNAKTILTSYFWIRFNKFYSLTIIIKIFTLLWFNNNFTPVIQH